MTHPNFFARAVLQLAVRDVLETQNYYRDVLGFRIEWTMPDNSYACISRDDTVFHLRHTPGEIAVSNILINVREVDDLCQEWLARGACVLSEPCDEGRGMFEFTLEDINGHCLRVGRPLGLLEQPESSHQPHFRIVHRLPSLDEYRSLIAAIGWTSFINFDAASASLHQSLFCAVAELEDGHFAGMARVTGDGQQCCSIMDVAVFPELQGAGIGTALVNEVVDFVQNHVADKAAITLFTTQNRSSFYRRFGFEGPETWLYGMSARRLHRA